MGPGNRPERPNGGGANKEKREKTLCTTDDDCVAFEGATCFTRKVKDGSTEPAESFCKKGGNGGGKNKGNGNNKPEKTACSTDDDCVAIEGATCFTRKVKDGSTEPAKSFCKKGGNGGGKNKGNGNTKPEKTACSTDDDCVAIEGATCFTRKVKDGSTEPTKSFCKKIKGGNGGGKNKGNGNNKPEKTACSTDDDCVAIEGTTCVTRKVKDGSTKAVESFCKKGGKGGWKKTGWKKNKGGGKNKGQNRQRRAANKGNGNKPNKNKGNGNKPNKGNGSKPNKKTFCSADADCAAVDGATCVELKQKPGKSVCKVAKVKPANKPNKKTSCSADADCAEGATCVERKQKPGTSVCKVVKVKAPPANKPNKKTLCSTDEDCVAIVGATCFTRKVKDGSTKEAKSFCKVAKEGKNKGGKN